MTHPRIVGVLAIVLVLSVAINLFLAGNQLGQYFHRPAPVSFEQRLDTLLQNLPEADRSVANAILVKHRRDIIEKFHNYRAAAQAAAAAIHSESFNEDGARAAFQKANSRSEEFRQAVQDTIVEIAGKVTPAGRESLRAGAGAP